MSKSRIRAVLYGAIAGSILGMSAMALFGGRFGLGSAVATPTSEGSVHASVEFMASTGGLYLIVLVIGVLGGLIIAGTAFAVGRENDPESPRFPLRYLLPVAAVVSALAAYTGLRVGLGGWGDITAGVATISVSAMVGIAAVTGAVAGALTSSIVDRLARPETLGLGGAAWPSSPGALMSDMVRAVGTPLIAVVAAGGFAIAFSEILLAAEGTAAVAIFSGMGAVALGGAALMAYRPWDKKDQPSS